MNKQPMGEALWSETNYLLEEDEVLLNKQGKVRKRKPKEPRMYFTEDTENAIIDYLQCDDPIQRDKIYKERIQYAFYKLSENIIHTFKIYYTDSDTIEELKHEVIVFMLEKLHLYHHSKNINDKLNKISKFWDEPYENGSFLEFTNNAIKITQTQIDEYIEKYIRSNNALYLDELKQISPPKAYSYFGTIAKRYLIIYNEKNYKKLQEYSELEEINDDSPFTPYGEDNYMDNKENDYSLFLDLYVKYIDKHLYSLFPKKADYKTADAIIELFRKKDSLEVLNKKALYIYIREMTEVSTPQITKITKKLDDIRNKLYNEYYEEGTIKI